MYYMVRYPEEINLLKSIGKHHRCQCLYTERSLIRCAQQQRNIRRIALALQGSSLQDLDRVRNKGA